MVGFVLMLVLVATNEWSHPSTADSANTSSWWRLVSTCFRFSIHYTSQEFTQIQIINEDALQACITQGMLTSNADWRLGLCCSFRVVKKWFSFSSWNTALTWWQVLALSVICRLVSPWTKRCLFSISLTRSPSFGRNNRSTFWLPLVRKWVANCQPLRGDARRTLCYLPDTFGIGASYYLQICVASLKQNTRVA